MTALDGATDGCDASGAEPADGGATRVASDRSVHGGDALRREAAGTGHDAGVAAADARQPGERAADGPAPPPFSSMRDVWVGTTALLVAWTAFLLQPLLGIVIVVGLMAIAAGVVRRWRAPAVTTGQDRRSP